MTSGSSSSPSTRRRSTTWRRRLTSLYSDGRLRPRPLSAAWTMTSATRSKLAFNDPADPVRILVATDAASEGLNLQETARTLLHLRRPVEPVAARAAQRPPRPARPGPRRPRLPLRDATTTPTSTSSPTSSGKVDDHPGGPRLHGRGLRRRARAPAHRRARRPRYVQEDLERRLADRPEAGPMYHDAREEDSGEEELRALRALAAEIDLDAERSRTRSTSRWA